jgi:hypothetical protein
MEPGEEVEQQTAASDGGRRWALYRAFMVAFEERLRLEFVRRIVEQNPDILMEKDGEYTGCTPLHIAAETRVRCNVVKYMVERLEINEKGPVSVLFRTLLDRG